MDNFPLHLAMKTRINRIIQRELELSFMIKSQMTNNKLLRAGFASTIFLLSPSLCAIGNATMSLANQSNNQGIAGVLDQLLNQSVPPSGVLGIIIDEMDEFQNAMQLNDSLAQLAPTVSGSISSTTFMRQRIINRTITTRLTEHQHAKQGNLSPFNRVSGIASGDTTSSYGSWVKLLGQHGHQKNRNNIVGFNDETWGIALGADMAITDNALGGIALSWTNSEVKEKISDTSWVNADSYQAMVYGQYEFQNPFFINWLASAAFNKYSTQRNVTFANLFFQPSGKYYGWQYTGELEAGSDLVNNGFHTIPLVSLFYSHLDLSAYTETGGGTANQIIQATDFDILLAGFGIKFAYDFLYKEVFFQPEVHFQALYDFIADRMALTSQFIGGGPSFTTSGVRPAHDNYNTGASISAYSKNTGLTFTASYDFDFRDDFTAHAGFLRLRYEW